MKHRLIILWFVVLWVGLSSLAFSQGQINVQNGNINHYYEDFAVPGHGFELALERSYNSLSTYSGMFGAKWGSNFDIDFNVTPEGTVEVTEYGGGFKTTFSPKGFNQSSIKDFVKKLETKIPDSSKSSSLEASLLKDAKLRHKLAREHKLSTDIPLGTTLQANDRGPETLEKTQKKGFDGWIWVRTFSDGRKEFFNTSGKLLRREDTNNNFLKLSYNSDGYLSTITDATGRQISFEYYPDKKIKNITSPLGKKCQYKFNLTGDLIYAKNDRGYEFNYIYDQRHRMTEVKYSKGAAKETMDYDDLNRIVLHSGPEDIITKYKYDTKGDPDKYFNVVVSKEIGKKPNQVITVDKYDYEFGRRDNGTRYTYKLATVLDGIKTETIYTPCCGKPVSINRQGQITRFDYWPSGSLKKKVFPTGESVALEYDEKFGKVSKVLQEDPKLKLSDLTLYQYDAKGNLAYAKNEKKKIYVRLIYDTKGRIHQLIDQSGKKINFEYNELGKPTKIALDGVGSISVSYSAGGEITNVKSTGGRKIAAEVTTTFQTLLDVIRPAGVSLNI